MRERSFTFKYDPLGRRIEKISPTTTSVFAYDGDNLIEETNSSGAVVARYTQTQNIDEPLAMLRSSAASYYNADGLGSVTSLTNSSGAAVQTYTYDSFGNLTNATGSTANPFSYASREFDVETGLYYNRARYYNPASGRFANEDPIKFAGGYNFYRYALGDPVGMIDPLGLSAINILVIPASSTAQTTKGTLVVQVNGFTLFQGYSLEPSGTGWTGNQLEPGVYDARVWLSPDFHYNVIRLPDNETFPMYGVEIHPGNYPRDTKGCILPGTKQDPKNPDYVGNDSYHEAFDRIMKIVTDTQKLDKWNGDTTTLTVTQF